MSESFRQLAVQIAGQLPQNQGDAIAVLDLTRQLVLFFWSECDHKKDDRRQELLQH